MKHFVPVCLLSDQPTSEILRQRTTEIPQAIYCLNPEKFRKKTLVFFTIENLSKQ
jgi:hypothetical protein